MNIEMEKESSDKEKIKINFFKIFPEFQNILKNQTIINFEEYKSQLKSKRLSIKYNLSKPIFDLFSSIEIHGILSKFFYIQLKSPKFEKEKIIKLIDLFSNSFGIDANGQLEALDYYLENNEIDFYWIVGVDENMKFQSQQSYNNMSFTIMLTFFDNGSEGILDINFISTILTLKDLGFHDANMPEEKWLDKVD